MHVVLLTPFVEETALKACFNQVLKILLEFDFLICEINALSFSPSLVSCLTLASIHRVVITGDTTQEALLRNKAQSWGLRVSTAGEQLLGTPRTSLQLSSQQLFTHPSS